MISEFGGPLPLTFDTEATFTPVGEPGAALVREIGIYMWASIPLDKSGWNKVHPALQAALLEHLKVSGLYNYICIIFVCSVCICFLVH